MSISVKTPLLTLKAGLISAVLLCFCIPLFAAQTGGGADITALLKKKYGGTQALRTEFDLTIFWKVREKTERKSGMLFIAKGDKFRLELGKNTWVSDGKTYWQYSAATSQVVIKQLSDVDLSMHPSQMISSYLDRFSYTVLENNGETAVLAWEAPGSDAKSETRSVTIWVDVKKLRINKFLSVDKSGNESTYTFKKTAGGISIPDSEFRYEIPQGVSVLDTRL
jgi:chaperone LolA